MAGKKRLTTAGDFIYSRDPVGKVSGCLYERRKKGGMEEPAVKPLGQDKIEKKYCFEKSKLEGA
jgi:hypothetical protein